MALPVLLYRVKFHDDVASGNPRLLSFRAFISDHSLGHHMRHFSYNILWPIPTIIPGVNVVTLADVLQICGGLVSLTLGQRCERFFLSDSRLAPALLSLPSLVELRSYGIGNVGLHAIRQIHGLRHLTLSSDPFSASVHSLDVSYIILGLADVLEELVLVDIFPIWQDLCKQSAAAGTVCLNIKKLLLLPPSPSPKYLAHMFPSVHSLWIYDTGVVRRMFSDESSSLSSSRLWPALTTVKGNWTAVKELASQCPTLQRIIVSAMSIPSVPRTESFLDAISLNCITSISFPMSIYSSDDFPRSAHQLNSILTKLSVGAPRLQYLSLTIRIWDSSDRTNDVFQLASYLHIYELARLQDLRYLFFYFNTESDVRPLPAVQKETKRETASTETVLALDIMGHLPNLEYFELGLGSAEIIGNNGYLTLLSKSLRYKGTSLWKRERDKSAEGDRVELVLNDDAWMRARAMYEGI